MKDYSQTGEQEHIARVLDGIRGARLLDIGAWDPECFSNSRALIEAGWGGVLIEPSPGPLSRLVRFYADRPDINVVAAAVTVGGGMIRLAITDDAVSQLQGERLETWRATGGFYGSMSVPSLSVVELFHQFGGDFQFVNIDVEGQSVDVFREMCRIGPRPRCVCVEHDARHVELAEIAEAAHYRQVHLNGNNAILEWTSGRPA